MSIDLPAVMNRVSPYLDVWDGILRRGHSDYTKYPPELVVDHDASTQAHCTNRHILAEANRVLGELPSVIPLEIRGQKLWLHRDVEAVVRFKKTDENGVSSNYQTQQARDFENGEEIPGLPQKPIRLNVGYLLDATGLGYVRSQIALPVGRNTLWCAAIVPKGDRRPGENIWRDVTREPRLTM